MKFYVGKEFTNLFGGRGKFNPPGECPCVLLMPDAWDDFGYRGQFDVYYYNESTEQCFVGTIKIIDSESHDNVFCVKDILSPCFEQLDEKFCSLGQKKEYYENVKQCFGLKYRDFLRSLNDCAISTSIQESFEKSDSWGSLIRCDQAEQLLRTANSFLSDRDMEDWYDLQYSFTLPYMEDEESLQMNFKFSKRGVIPKRIFAIIGKNGAGKTQAISGIPMAIKKGMQDDVEHAPLFGKIISASNSFYDNFEIPEANQEFNYFYCGLAFKNDNGGREILSDDAQERKLKEALASVRRKGRMSKLIECLEIISEGEFLNEIQDSKKSKAGKIVDFFKHSSSGQGALIYILANIIAHIRFDSLLLLDELENHLHPGAITNLMRVIYELLDEYDSFAIITTHSAMVIREVYSECVYILERENKYAYIRPVRIETLGGDISEIVTDVFGRSEGMQSYFFKRAKEIIDEGVYDNYEALITKLSGNYKKLGLSSSLYLQSILSMKKHETTLS